MYRRDILKGMLALPAAGWLRAYGTEFNQEPSRPAASGSKLAVILQGPFGVVLQRNKGNRVTAFVPKTGDAPSQHEFRLLTPMMEKPLECCPTTYQFELLGQGLKPEEGSPQIDPGFSNVEFSVNTWVPRPEDYFVMLDLPKPDVVTYIPPLYPAAFATGHDSDGRYQPDSEADVGVRLGSAPLNHVLEYTLDHRRDVVLRQKPTGDQGNAQDHGAYSYEKMLKEYERYYKSTPDQAEEPSLSQRPFLLRWLAGYSHIYFLGVGLRPYSTNEMTEQHMNRRIAHGIKFFNDRLLPAVFQRQKVPPSAMLKKLGKDALPCGPGSSGQPSQHGRPSAWNDLQPQPRLLTVASTENCATPGVLVLTPR